MGGDASRQAEEFLDAFKSRFRKATGEQLDQYRSTSIKYFPEKKEDDDTFVPTEVLVKGEPTHVDYRMREQKGAWRIVDIVVDDRLHGGELPLELQPDHQEGRDGPASSPG